MAIAAVKESADAPSMGRPTAIGIDLGGTAIKLGRFLEDGTCVEDLTLDTPQPSYPQPVIKSILGAIAYLNRERTVVAIGIGSPGPADRTGRIAKVAINLEGWHDVPLAEALEQSAGLPAIVENDANCAGLGEMWLGAGQQYQNLILLTLGTGVGGAIFINGKLFTGHYGAAGELGLITLDPDGFPCRSGNQGSLEQYASIQGVYRRTGKNPSVLGQLAIEGDRQALNFWEDYGRRLGAGVASLVYVLTPEVVLLGGGISASADFFLPALRSEVERRVMPTSREGLQILTAALGNRAGMVGAARLAWERLARGNPL